MRGMDMQLRSSDNSAAHSMHATQNLAQQLGIRSSRRPVLGLQLDPDEDESSEQVEQKFRARLKELELKNISEDIEKDPQWETFMGPEAVASGRL